MSKASYNQLDEAARAKLFHAVQVGQKWRINKRSLFKYAGIEPDTYEGAEELPDMLTVKQTADMLGVSQRTVLRLCHEAAAA